jgi:uncharacterized protein YjbJ (UPF0337 family)
MNAQVLEGDWNTIRGLVKAKWGQLTDDDLLFADGNIDMLIGRIQQRTGEGREAIERYLDELTSHGASAISSAAHAAGHAAQQVAGRLRSQYGQVAEEAHARVQDVEEMVRRNPAETMIAAFGVGLVVGMIVGLALRPR